jgi:hypothetical protein
MLMKLVTWGAAAGLVAACGTDQPAPTGSEITIPLYVGEGQKDFNLGTHLTGDEEVFVPATPGGPTPALSRAQGQAIFRVSDNETTVEFKLIASNINNVIMAHIHCGRFGENGPIRMWLDPVIGPSGSARDQVTVLRTQNGVLAQGSFLLGTVTCPTSAVGGTVPMPLLDAMRAGLTYVNVHTNDFVDPTNTGPGDFPGGEIRGQIDHASAR